MAAGSVKQRPQMVPSAPGSSRGPRRVLIGLALLLAAGSLAGCATSRDIEDSDLPWSTPRDWEAAPTFPGMEGR
jgi:hypothetical protein